MSHKTTSVFTSPEAILKMLNEAECRKTSIDFSHVAKKAVKTNNKNLHKHREI